MCEKETPKKAKKVPQHECTVVLIDVGSNMKSLVTGVSMSALDYAKKTVDWILTRKVNLVFKIFTESADEFILIFFGTEETKNPFSSNENIVFFETEMQTAKIDWLRMLQNEVKPSTNVEGDFLTALIEGVNFLRSFLENAANDGVIGSNILLLTNLDNRSSAGNEQDLEAVEAIISGITALHTTFNIIGPALRYLDNDLGDKNEKIEKHIKTDLITHEMLLTEVVRRCKGISYSFDETLNMLSRFIPRKVATRGQRFLFQIGADVKIPLIFYKKIQIADMKLHFKKFDSSTASEIKRKSFYEKKEEDVSKVEEDAAVKNSPTTLLKKEDVVKGYTFGSTIVPFNDADFQEYGWKREIRTLSLIQFAKRSEVYFFIRLIGCSNIKLYNTLIYFVLWYGTYTYLVKAGCVALSALVRALIEEDSIAIARYVYNAASLPKLLALFPKISSKGVDMFVGIQLPFYEDFRGLEFPAMELSSSIKGSLFSDFEIGEYDEAYRPKNVPNPKIQRLCEVVKFRALHPGEQLPMADYKTLSNLLSPQPRLMKLSRSTRALLECSFNFCEPLMWIKKYFTLHEIKKTKDHSENTKGFDGDSLFGKDNDTLPASGRFITSDEIKKEDV
uniref:Ku domain-containing protein n=1 Tax=Syphacia muris TaxID=451379 RepID=A0A0N5AP56_9BILA